LNELPVGTLPQSTEVLLGNPTKTGAVVSMNVVVCDAEVVLPQSSVTDQVRTREYPHAAGTVLAERATTRSLSQLSVALTTAFGTA
jgi:hypothetical protein